MAKLLAFRRFSLISQSLNFFQSKAISRSIFPLYRTFSNDLQQNQHQQEKVNQNQQVEKLETQSQSQSQPTKPQESNQQAQEQFIDFSDFQKIKLITGKVLEVTNHPNADKLYVLKIDDGSEKNRTICAGLKNYLTPEQIIGQNVVLVSNLKPRKMRGILSEGMILAASHNEAVSIVSVNSNTPAGSTVS